MTSPERESILAHARAARAEEAALLKRLERTLKCPKEMGCVITLYIPGDAWCPHGKMKEEK